LTDQVDSVKVVVNEKGAAVSRFEYLPFGEEWVSEQSSEIEEDHSPKFNSQELDRESGFYFYNARHYDPVVGRFVSADVVIDGEFDTQGWNRFSYVKGNPVWYKDPSGHITIAIELNRDDPYGAKAIQLFEGKSIFKFYDKWVTRGVNKKGQEVAIKSDFYDYNVEDSSKNILKKTPRLMGKNNRSMTGEDVSGGYIETLGKNDTHKDNTGNSLMLANGIRQHRMRDKPKKNDPKHGGKDYVYSEGCNGPVGKKDTDKFLEGKNIGDKGKYLLIRPVEYLDKAKNILSTGLSNIKTNVNEILEQLIGD